MYQSWTLCAYKLNVIDSIILISNTEVNKKDNFVDTSVLDLKEWNVLLIQFCTVNSSELLYCCMHSKYDVTWVIKILRGSVVFYFHHLQVREQICRRKFLGWFINVNRLVISAVRDGAGVLNSWISESRLNPYQLLRYLWRKGVI
jgi:hypothetical protein